MIERFYDKTMATQRPVSASDGEGGWAQTLVPRLAGVPCSSRPTIPSERTVGDQELARATDIVYCPATADVRRDDVVTLSPRGPASAVVRGVEDPGYQGRYLKVWVETVQRGA